MEDRSQTLKPTKWRTVWHLKSWGAQLCHKSFDTHIILVTPKCSKLHIPMNCIITSRASLVKLGP
jgi:hypothetical protein